MLAWREPAVLDAVTLWSRWRRFGTLPRAGGLDDQDPRDLDVLELMDAIMQDPWPPRERDA